MGIREGKDLNCSVCRGQESSKQTVNEAGQESLIGCGGDCGTEHMPSLKEARLLNSNERLAYDNVGTPNQKSVISLHFCKWFQI